MHDQCIDPHRLHRFGEVKQGLVRILIIYSYAALNGNRNLDGSLHCGNAIADQCRFRHQAGAETTFLHPVGRASNIEIDFVVAKILDNPRRLRQRTRVTSAELKRHRMLKRVKRKQPTTIAMQHCAGCKHFSVDQGPARQQPMEKPAMPVGPFHHRSDTKAPLQVFSRFFLFLRHFATFVCSSFLTFYGSISGYNRPAETGRTLRWPAAPCVLCPRLTSSSRLSRIAAFIKPLTQRTKNRRAPSFSASYFRVADEEHRRRRPAL